MTNLEDLVPPHTPVQDALVSAGKAGLSLIPFVGGVATEGLAYAVDRRQSARQHEFNVAIAEAMTETISRLDSSITIEDIAGSDEFIAGVTRAQRAAAETASQDKRRRLASAVANGGGWAPFSASEREQFTRLVDEFSELHIWLLHYFTDPAGWLKARDLYAQHSNTMMGGISGPLRSALGTAESVWGSAVTQAAADIERTGLGYIPLKTSMSLQGIMEPRTSEKGRRFLSFINESDSIAAEPPAEI